MEMNINVQIVSSEPVIPAGNELIHWARASLGANANDAEITIRIVDKNESRSLNNQWRNVNEPANVLSFPLNNDENLSPALLGDIVICAPVIRQQAAEQNKSTKAHWAHMIVHGVLHLTGYDHIKEDEAEIMESKEISILKNFGFPNPYSVQN